jgi:hypothetical protein
VLAAAAAVCACCWAYPAHLQISALRLLSSRPENNVRFLVLTTKIINGRTLLESFIDPPAKSTRKA